ncbi:uncharacterized protein LOC141628145 [Silene latifolia]|uniref:uncharacterized protein LOC141628145 n=1 Tax=Silene latifolia TaxID=37657 RepID=UPI003D77F6A1
MKIDLKKAYDSIEWSFIEDDLYLFCKGDLNSVRVLMRGFLSFSDTSGLCLNQSKSDLYMDRMNQMARAQILQLSGFQQGWGTKKLSYAGPLVLVKHVLTQMNSYWARVFLLPKGVIARVEAICRNYLWSHADNFAKVPLISWEQCCLPQKNGGLGILNACLWNNAMFDWWDYQAPSYSDWSWHQLCKVKNKLMPGFTAGNWPTYTVRDGYKWLLGQPLKVQWSSYVWNRVALPKVAFINWLYINHRLITKDRMGRFGMVSDGLSFLCGSADESIDHLFFNCWFSRCCVRLDQLWLPAPWQPNVVEWLIHWRCKSLLKKQLMMATIVGLIYLIWESMNISRVENRVSRPKVVVKNLQSLIALRARGLLQLMGRHRDHEWIKSYILAH